MSALLRYWPALAALGGGLVLIAVGAGLPGAGAAFVAVGLAGLGWAVAALRLGRLPAP
ncbi:hypothetical protein GB864_16585, partial [Agromyces sp. MMS17-SY077]|nr:hypothetical protein [Agromyces seonyuensis]